VEEVGVNWLGIRWREWVDAVLRKQAEPPTLDPLAINRAHAVERARRIAAKPSVYVLGAGGRDPLAETPFTVRDGRRGSDCVGFTSWCLGHDRYQPATFGLFSGWINTDSLMTDARGKQSWYAQVAKPEPGDVVVFPSILVNGDRKRMGHIALVVSVPRDFPQDFSFTMPDTVRRRWLSKVGVIDCAGSRIRKERGYAVAETTAAASWDKPDAIFARLIRAV
jgi:hypothetical protein